MVVGNINFLSIFPAGNYMFKVAIATLEQGVNYVQSYEHTCFLPCFSASTANFEQVITGWI